MAIDTTPVLQMALNDFGEAVTIAGTQTTALISSITEGEQAGFVDDHTLVAEILADGFVNVPRNTKLIRSDGSVWRVTNRPRIEHGSWVLELSREMISV